MPYNGAQVVFNCIGFAYTQLLRGVNMLSEKPLYASKTGIGIIIVLLSVVLNSWFGIDLGDETGDLIENDVVTIIGCCVAIYGRIVASDRVTGLLN